MDTTKVKYKIDNKFVPLGSMIFFSILFISATFMVSNSYPNLSTPALFLSLSVFVVLLFTRDLFLFVKIWAFYTMSMMILTLFFITHFFINIYLSTDGWVTNILLLFVLLFYTAFTYDIFVIFKKGNIKNAINLKNIPISAHEEKNNIIIYHFDDLNNAIGKTNGHVNNAFTVKLFFIFGLPFVLLGKGAAYFLTLGAGEYLNAEEYIIATIGFVLIMTVFLFMVRAFIIFLYLKKPH